jgi:hypothetical protein
MKGFICGWVGRATLFNIVVIPLIIYIATILHKPEIINKGGASLSALGALFVIYQGIRETRIEKRQNTDPVVLENLEPPNREIAEKYLNDRAARRRSERIQIVIAIALMVCIGEILHGWGELMYLGGTS